MHNSSLITASVAAFLSMANAYSKDLTCTFTEPYLTVLIQESKKKVTITNNIENTTQVSQIDRITKLGKTTQVVFGSGEEELTGLTYKLDFKGSNLRSEVIFPYSAEMQTGDTSPQLGGCMDNNFPVTQSVLDCTNLGDAIEFKVCEASLAIECEDSAKTVVSRIHAIRTGKPVKIVRTKELVQGLRYSVKFKSSQSTKTQTNFVTVSQARHGSSCAATSVEKAL